ncbi:hypothetical protein KY312_04825, partial [Candidatus Woesearchaeota archaeon]|nr:hypothetical protein [Candidatus Woesearchaeota archaeon]
LKVAFYNKRLASAFERKSTLIDLLRYDLTYIGRQRKGSIEKRVGLEFEKISAKNYIIAAENDGWIWREKHRKEQLKIIKTALKQNRPTLKEYIKTGLKAVKKFGFPYHRFSTEKVLSYLNVAEDQQKTFTVGLYNLAISHLAEQAMREMLIENDKEFIGRAFLYHNSPREQEEKDIIVVTEKGDKTLGIRCQKYFSGIYLYPKKRIFSAREKIADYVVFFSHFAHHIFYITGIVKKSFLKKERSTTFNQSPMEEFPMPEFDGFYDKRKLKKILSFDEFMEKLR